MDPPPRATPPRNAKLPFMRAVLQRVTQARVEVDGRVVGEISGGILVLLGVAKPDTTADAELLSAKILNLRIFTDEAGKMNRSLLDTGGALLVVSQFTLYGDCRKAELRCSRASGTGARAVRTFRRGRERKRAENRNRSVSGFDGGVAGE